MDYILKSIKYSKLNLSNSGQIIFRSRKCHFHTTALSEGDLDQCYLASHVLKGWRKNPVKWQRTWNCIRFRALRFHLVNSAATHGEDSGPSVPACTQRHQEAVGKRTRRALLSAQFYVLCLPGAAVQFCHHSRVLCRVADTSVVQKAVQRGVVFARLLPWRLSGVGSRRQDIIFIPTQRSRPVSNRARDNAGGGHKWTC